MAKVIARMAEALCLYPGKFLLPDSQPFSIARDHIAAL